MNTGPRKGTMTPDQLTAILVERVLGWRATPDRFLTGNRSWVPRWKFQPARNLKDAIRLLEATAPDEYAVGTDGNGGYWVRIRIGKRTVYGRDRCKPLAICRAVAAVVGIEVDLP